MATLVAEANRIEEHEGMGVLVILDRSGDTKHIWDPTSDVEVAEMRRLFGRMIDKGYQAWSVSRKGDKDQRITTFDSTAEKIIFAPALVGG
jgi:hypothetical protein